MPADRHTRPNVRTTPYVKHEANSESVSREAGTDASPASVASEVHPAASPRERGLGAEAGASVPSDTSQASLAAVEESDKKAPRARWPYNQSDPNRIAELRAEWDAGMYDQDKPSPLSDDVDGFGFFVWMVTRLSRSYVGLYYRILEHIWLGKLTSRERAILHDRGFRKERPQDYPEDRPLIVEEEDIW